MRLTRTCAMTISSQLAPTNARSQGLTICSGREASDGMDRMFVADVEMDARDFVRVPKAEAVVDVNGHDRRVGVDEKFLGFAQKLRAFDRIGERVRARHQDVVGLAL